MLGKLKEMASSATADKAIASLEPFVSEQLIKLQSIGAEIVRDNTRYAQHIIEPAYLTVTAASHGVTKLIPEFKERFSQLMLRVRDELLIVEDNAVRLVEDFKARLPSLLAESLKS